ncbi:hypothetical protein [Amycolatopsis sp. FDAARGOS 1241]|uniref:hypothetical protein n=1 Tax=Amycolatopsis sp. FDAARGOS 1241 TaxID=2778070 RepID=UPI001EF39F7F|nr:hypothetical protein [Amycolatopsis sp. FDAARGOS 1241]
MGGGALRRTRAVVVLAASVVGGVALVLPAVRYTTAKFPDGVPSPDLSLALRLVCAAALAAAVALGWVALKRRSDEVLAFATLPALIVVGIAVRYLVRTLPGLADLFPAAAIAPGLGAWVLLGVGVLLTLTGLASGFAVKRG